MPNGPTPPEPIDAAALGAKVVDFLATCSDLLARQEALAASSIRLLECYAAGHRATRRDIELAIAAYRQQIEGSRTFRSNLAGFLAVVHAHGRARAMAGGRACG